MTRTQTSLRSFCLTAFGIVAISPVAVQAQMITSTLSGQVAPIVPVVFDQPATSSISVPAPSVAYSFHVCVANAVYDNNLGSLSLILRFQRKDLELALNRFFSRGNIQVGDAEHDPKHLMGYLNETLKLLDENYKTTPMTYIGQAVEGDVVAVFVEAKLFKPETMLILFDSMMELHDEQYNIINISLGGRQYSKVFRKGQETQRFTE